MKQILWIGVLTLMWVVVTAAAHNPTVSDQGVAVVDTGQQIEKKAEEKKADTNISSEQAIGSQKGGIPTEAVVATSGTSKISNRVIGYSVGLLEESAMLMDENCDECENGEKCEETGRANHERQDQTYIHNDTGKTMNDPPSVAGVTNWTTTNHATNLIQRI